MYFGEIMPKLSKYMEIFPVGLYEILKKLGDNANAECLGLFWDSVLSEGEYDAMWTYSRPDEVTIDKCRQYNIPIVIQEYYGHYPYNITALFPFDCDIEKAYGGKEADRQISSPGKKSPVITVALSEGLYSVENRLDVSISRYQGKSVHLHPFWQDSNILNSYLTYVSTIVEICRGCSELQDCKLMIRPHPRYPALFKEVADYVKNIGSELLVLDFSSVEDSLKETDIILNVNSNYGFDGIRAGCEIITFEDRAFYSNPFLTHSPENPLQLKETLIKSVEKIRKEGKILKNYIPGMLKDMEGILSNSCLGPYDIEHIGNSFEYAVKLPVIKR